MKYEIVDNKFVVEWQKCDREINDYRTESLLRAQSIAETNNKIYVCVSGGIDSQIMVKSFLSQDIPVNYIFFRAGDFNTNEHDAVKELEKRFSIQIDVCEVDPIRQKDNILKICQSVDVHPNHALQRMFCEQLPLDCTIVQGGHDPWIISKRDNNTHYLYSGYYDADVSRIRAISSIPTRSGNVILWNDCSTIFSSIVTDRIFTDFLTCYRYYDNRYLQIYNKKLHDVHRYDYFIKPMLFAKWWGDQLVYYPKYRGYEEIQWIKEYTNKDELLCTMSELTRAIEKMRGY